eukprot:scaffold4802_cov267-Chaetoceros_neogracile.AAC.43
MEEVVVPLWRIIRSKYGRGAFRQDLSRTVIHGHLTNYEYDKSLVIDFIERQYRRMWKLYSPDPVTWTVGVETP